MTTSTASTSALTKGAPAMLLVLTLVWGTNWPLFPMVLREMSVWHFRGISLVVAGLVLLGSARLSGHSLALPRAHWPMVVLASVTYLGLWNIASAVATTLVPSGQAAVLGFTMPLWLALLAWIFQGQTLSPRLQAALALGTVAVLLLFFPNLKNYAQAPLGTFLGLLAGLGWAAGTLMLKKHPVPVPVIVLTGWQLLICSVAVWIAAWLVEPTPLGMIPASAVGAGPSAGQALQPISATVWWLVAYIAVVPMSLGNLMWFKLVNQLPAQVAGLSSILVPIVAMVAGALVHREPLGWLQWAAMACSAWAVALAIKR